LNNYIKHIGQVSHEEAISISSGAKLLLIIDWDMEESPILRAKLSDYAMTGRPILAVTPKRSAVRDYIEKYGGGVAVVHKEDEIYNALIRLAKQIETGKEKSLLDTKKLAEQFSIDFISKKYLEVFNKVISIS
jgi:glycosyltransferase involved in cell wall biosynthesis